MFLKDINTTGQKLEMACDQPDLKIKCRHDNNNCDRPRKKKYHRRKFKFHNKKFYESFPQKEKIFQIEIYKKRKDIDVSYVAILQKNCTHQKNGKILHQIYATTKIEEAADIESVYSEEDEQSLSAISNVMTLFFHQCFKKNQKED